MGNWWDYNEYHDEYHDARSHMSWADVSYLEDLEEQERKENEDDEEQS